MIKWFYKLCSKVAGFAASLGIDGLTHIIVMTIISKMALIFLPVNSYCLFSIRVFSISSEYP